jgi:hypothetical protein
LKCWKIIPRFFQAVDQAQQGALAGARMADQAEHFAVLDGQVGRLQGRDFAALDAVRLVDAMEFDHCGNLVGSSLAGSAKNRQVYPLRDRRRKSFWT